MTLDSARLSLEEAQLRRDVKIILSWDLSTFKDKP
jgi:hypothetical protein